MKLIFTRKSSTITALAGFVFAILFLALSCIDPVDHYPSQVAFWIGFGVSTLAMAIIGATSYAKEKHGYTKQDVQNLQKTVRSLDFMGRTFWLWLFTVIAIGVAFSRVYAPFAMGLGVGFFVSISLLVLADNAFKIGIFVWNSHHAQIRRMYSDDK